MNNIILLHTDIRYFHEKIINWERQHSADFPWRKTQNAWHALVAEIMLQRTRAEQVLPIYKHFAEKYKSPCDYAIDKRATVFKGLGLRWRERHLKNLASTLCNSDLKKDKKCLLELPGIGEYVASAYLSLHTNVENLLSIAT